MFLRISFSLLYWLDDYYLCVDDILDTVKFQTYLDKLFSKGKLASLGKAASLFQESGVVVPE